MLADATYCERQRVRIEIPFPVILRGKDATNERFELHSTLDHLSGRDLSLRVARPLTLGSTLFIYVYFSMALAQQCRGARVAMHGTVQRVDPVGVGYWRAIITFDRHRFLYASMD